MLDRIGQPKQSLLARRVEAIGQHAPISPRDAQATRRTLMAAGYRAESAVAFLYGIKLILAVSLGILAIVFRDSMTASPVMRIVLPVGPPWPDIGFPASCWSAGLPNVKRSCVFSARRIDLMVVSVEQAWGWTRRCKTSAANWPWRIRSLATNSAWSISRCARVSAGPRHYAIWRSARRIRAAQADCILIQSDRFGTSMAEALRTHSEFMRVRRRQEAEERAAKVGVKLVFPIFFFILPSILVVSAGPGILQVFKYLIPMMKGVQ